MLNGVDGLTYPNLKLLSKSFLLPIVSLDVIPGLTVEDLLFRLTGGDNNLGVVN